MQLELVPRVTDIVTDEVVAAQVAQEKASQAEKERLFLVYAKQWWKEFLQIRPTHKDRTVKIFAQVCIFLLKLNKEDSHLFIYAGNF